MKGKRILSLALALCMLLSLPALASRETDGETVLDTLRVDGNTTSDIVNNAIYIYMMEVTAIMADAIGESEYAETLRARHDLAKAEWNEVYVDPATGMTRSASGAIMDSQASYATPLNFNCFSDENRPMPRGALRSWPPTPTAPTAAAVWSPPAAARARPAVNPSTVLPGPSPPASPARQTFCPRCREMAK